MSTFSKALLLSFIAAAPVLAQGNPQTRQGFTISFGIGGGTAGTSCQGCDSEREWGPTMYLQLGGTPRPNLILAGEVNGWSKTSEDDLGNEATVTISTVNFVTQWYPQVTGGFFVNGGIGIGAISAEIDIPGFGSAKDNTTGFGYQVGIGYDVRLARNFSLTPYAKYFATAGGKWEDTEETFDGNVVQFGLGFTWH